MNETTESNLSSEILYKYFMLYYILEKNYGFKHHPTYPGNNMCAICFDKLQTNIIELPCNDVYHDICLYKNIMEFQRLSCPSCYNLYILKKN